ncbi:MAG TPA: hypothetical protein PLU22_08390, partial [Polyangiaceae bacterium]|nr:hypothetical protein [Polyangiaceae bacterium]
QPADTGRVRWPGGEASVAAVSVDGADVLIDLDADVPDGVHMLECALDAPRRRKARERRAPPAPR